jgi:Bifunctional DNA primase/polymerase, N-terminal
MKQPLESERLEPTAHAPNVPQSISREDKVAARKTAKTDWNASPPFPIASDPASWGKALSAASLDGSILEAARALVEAGVPVFPVSSVGQKKPLNAHGVYSATIDLAVVGRDFGQHSNALIAVPMGRRTGVFAIDVDASPPHAHDGVAA